MVANLWNHKGSAEAAFADLETLPLVERTATYSPLSHHEFIYNAHNVGDEILGPHGFSLTSEKYLLSTGANSGARMFFMLGYKNGAEGMEMAVAGRNSTDKSMSIALSMGSAGRVIVCDNMMVSGEIVIFRRHTGDIFKYLKDKLVLGFHEARGQWRDLVADVSRLKEVTMDERDAHHFLVEAGRNKAITQPAFFEALKQYHEPQHEEFREPNMWSVYNAVTEALKATPIQATLERHKAFHDFARDFAGHKKVVSTFEVEDGENIQRDEATI